MGHPLLGDFLRPEITALSSGEGRECRRDQRSDDRHNLKWQIAIPKHHLIDKGVVRHIIAGLLFREFPNRFVGRDNLIAIRNRWIFQSAQA